MTSIEELLEKNIALQNELTGFLSFVDSVEKRNEEAKTLCDALILTRQQAKNKSARPSKASIKLDSSVRSVSAGSQLTSSLWCHDGECPDLSEESSRMREILSRVPPCFRSSFFWKAKEIQSLCYGVLSIVQEKLTRFVFEAVLPEDEKSIEMLRHGIEECRRVRLDSSIALQVIKDLSIEDWECIAEKFLEKRTPFECQIQWNCFVKPDRNQSPFSTKEAAELKQIAENHKLANWDQIAIELGTGRHPSECLRFYRQHFDLVNKRWTKEEDGRVMKAWKDGGMDSLKVLNIHLGRDFRSVVARCRHLHQKHKFKSGRWLPNEDLQLLKAVLKHGLCWESVAKEVYRRSSAQCRERFVYALEPSLHRSKGSRWAEEDTDHLKKLVEQHLQMFGKIKWALLAKNFEGISPRDLLNKWNFMMERNAPNSP